MEKISKKKPNADSAVWDSLGLAWELGYTIAIPLVVFALLGRFLDQHFHRSPLFLLIGIFLAFIISSYAVYQKTIQIYQELDYISDKKAIKPKKESQKEDKS